MAGDTSPVLFRGDAVDGESIAVRADNQLDDRADLGLVCNGRCRSAATATPWSP
jgi:hypothetical protein